VSTSIPMNKPMGIVPRRCDPRNQPQGFLPAITIGPCREVRLDGTGVEHFYEDDGDAAMTAPRLTWALERATAPFAVELRWAASVVGGSTDRKAMLLMAFSIASDEAAYRATFP